jgi:hypothetical protein
MNHRSPEKLAGAFRIVDDLFLELDFPKPRSVFCLQAKNADGARCTT